MATDPKLLNVEDSLKQKYLAKVREMTSAELKRFSKQEYAELVLKEMAPLLPDFDKAQLKTTAHYISNALNNEVQALSGSKSRNSSLEKQKNTDQLSESVLKDLETSMQPENSHECCEADNSDVDCDDNSDLEQTKITQANTTDNTEILDNSITVLKHIATTESKLDRKTNKIQKCCETCTIKPKGRKSYPMIRCSLCTAWYHEKCVGVEKDEPIGVWLCLTCRNVPQGLQSDLAEIKQDVDHLKHTTGLIIDAISKLSTQVETCIGDINDQLTALNRKINTNDNKISEAVEKLTDKTNSLKTDFDQKSNQILNKTATIADKLTKNNETMKNSKSQKPDTSAKTQTSTISDKPDKSIHQQNQPRSEPNSGNNGQIEPSNTKDKPKKVISPNNQQSGNPIPESSDFDQIDLTKSPKPKKYVNQSTLLVGSSILKGIKTNQLKKGTAVRSFPGATIPSLQNQLKNYNIEKCKTIMIHVGGNDADQGVDLDTFNDSYSTLLNNLTSPGRRLIVSGLLPRETVDLDSYNKGLKTLCQNKNIEFVDHYNGFLLASGDIADSYFQRDKVHLNPRGIRKLLQNLDTVIKVTEFATTSDDAWPIKRNHYNRPQTGVYPKANGIRSGPKYCHICDRRGHDTKECWFNSRNAGPNGFGTW